MNVRARSVAFLALVLSVPALAEDPPAAAPSAAALPLMSRSRAEVTAWMRSPVKMDRELPEPVTVKAVRVGKDHGFERLVVEFPGVQLPGYRIELLSKPPTTCAKGDPASVKGTSWLLVHLAHAEAHAGSSTPVSASLLKKLSVVMGVEKTCDFEGTVDWAVGVQGNPLFRVLELKKPTRLVVDLKE